MHYSHDQFICLALCPGCSAPAYDECHVLVCQRTIGPRNKSVSDRFRYVRMHNFSKFIFYSLDIKQNNWDHADIGFVVYSMTLYFLVWCYGINKCDVKTSRFIGASVNLSPTVIWKYTVQCWVIQSAIVQNYIPITSPGCSPVHYFWKCFLLNSFSPLYRLRLPSAVCRKAG